MFRLYHSLCYICCPFFSEDRSRSGLLGAAAGERILNIVVGSMARCHFERKPGSFPGEGEI